MGKETDRIARQLEKSYDKYPWYGLSIMEILNSVTLEMAGLRHGEAHSIIELVLHMTSWRTFITKRLQGDDAYKITDETNFPRPGSWSEALQGFKESQSVLVEAIKKFPDERLDELVVSDTHKYTFYTLLHGIIQHDIYHLGQIAYIKRSFTK